MIDPVLAFSLNHISTQQTVVVVAAALVLMSLIRGIFGTAKTAVIHAPMGSDATRDLQRRHDELLQTMRELSASVAELRTQTAEITRMLKEVS